MTTGKQLANDSSTEVVMHQGTAGTGEHSNPDTNHGHSPEQQHAEPNNPTTSKVVALLSISNPSCGNLIQEDTEQCDGGLGGNATCNADCTLKTLHGEVIATAACGNGIVDPGEQCDDANDSNEDDCTQYCKTPVCGDGYVQGSNGEQCDDKNRIDTDGCNNACQSSTTTVVTTTTVTERVNDDGGTTRTPTTTTPPDTTPTTTTTTGGGTTTTTSDLCEVTPVVADDAQLSVSGAFTKTSGRYTVRPNEFAKFKCNVPAGTGIVTIFSEILNCGAEGVFDNALPECVAEDTPPTDPVLCADGVTSTVDGCVCTNFVNTDPNRALSFYTPIPGSVTSPGSIYTFSCIDGFEILDDNQTMTCTMEGKWSNEPPACTLSAEDDVSCDAEYTSCWEDANEQENTVYAACQTFCNGVFECCGANSCRLAIINRCTMEGVTARISAYNLCSSELNSCRN